MTRAIEDTLAWLPACACTCHYFDKQKVYVSPHSYKEPCCDVPTFSFGYVSKDGSVLFAVGTAKLAAEVRFFGVTDEGDVLIEYNWGNSAKKETFLLKKKASLPGSSQIYSTDKIEIAPLFPEDDFAYKKMYTKFKHYYTPIGTTKFNLADYVKIN